MARISMIFCLLGALSPSLLYHHYVFVKQNMTWLDAQNYCQTKYTDLVTIQNQSEMDYVNDIIKGAESKGVWIGLYRNTSTRLFLWSNGDQFMYSQWRISHPGNDKHLCTAMLAEWTNYLCNETFFFVCFQDSSNSYYMVSQAKNWTEARDHCRAQQADLVSIRNETEFQTVKSIIADKTTWIGLYWASSSGQWQWADGSFSSYQNWDYIQPDGTENTLFCVQVNVKDPVLSFGKWDDIPCRYQFNAICYQDVNFYLIKKKKTFLEAVFYCSMYHTDIVSIQHKGEQLQIANVASDASGDGVWIGLRKHQVSEKWIWMNKDPVCYTNWDNSNTEKPESYHCAVTSKEKNFTWSKTCCSSRYMFICY
ncbi:C-type mannose receptor 2-like [Protopterus annectens]|uniref:C-type mannose receptor 2-like n=1 Tax=Protopterus annectens TaxID=7888 RepID=UPI001CFB98AB|nr:C-type mannose receptor 2-like [Protopterus annectens]XP_043938369.1 C-type mannose receptor 2-like [Protopterus annectens]